MLCAVCVWMFQKPSQEGKHHDTYHDLAKAAESGCKICLYVQSFRDKEGADAAGEQNRPFTTYDFMCYGGSMHQVMIHSEASWPEHCFMDLLVSEPCTAPRWWTTFVRDIKRDLRSTPWSVREEPTRHVPTNTGDPEVSKLALQWLDTCQDHHSSCRAATQTLQANYFPERLLDVGTPDHDQIRLIITDDEMLSHEEQYATLSYCWGKNPSFIRPTNENLSKLNVAISPQILPQGFMDGIISCRRLNIRYLWIDSLCILQSGPGAEEDWQRHVGQMHKIYANGILNIGIAHAASPEQGAFVDRNTAFMQTATVYMHAKKDYFDRERIYSTDLMGCVFDEEAGDVDYPEPGSAIRKWLDGINPWPTLSEVCQLSMKSVVNMVANCLHQTSRVTVFAETRDHFSSLQNQPLWTRGWVFQERMMAPRMLVFGSDRIFWRCHERVWNEYLPHGSAGSAVELFSLPDVSLRSEPPTEQHLSQYHQQWYELVCHYSATDLTFPGKDKLAAMAAISAHFDRLIPGRYCAGLFEDDLHFGLLWTSRRRNGPPASLSKLNSKLIIDLDEHESHEDQAPTWSWASINYGVRFQDSTMPSNRKPMATIESVATVLKNPQNAFGQVISAELTVSGTLTLLSLDQLESWTLSPHSQGFKARLSGSDIFGLFIMETVRDFHCSTGHTHFHLNGILLSHVQCNMYRRVGKFHVRGPQGGTCSLLKEGEYKTVVIV